MQAEIGKACANPDVSSEPGQVNFACGKTTRQMLWVFALLTSHNNPDFAEPKTGRVGLEPITPAQGGVVAWSLNLHHPYDPTSPVDSLEVAARAMNNIIGGATADQLAGQPRRPAGPGEPRRELSAVHRLGEAHVAQGVSSPVRPAGVKCGRPGRSRR